MNSRPTETCHFSRGERVTVIDSNGAERGTGEVVSDDHKSGYVGVKMDGESGWYEWPRGWCWMA